MAENFFRPEGDNNIGIQGVKDSTINIHQNKKPLPKELSAEMPKTQISEIVGRTNELEQLHQNLFTEQSKQIVLVNGLGGVGKTTLAQVYCTQYYEQYQHLLWVSCQKDGDLFADLVQCGGLIQHFDIGTEGQTTDSIGKNLVAKLKAIDAKPCLLVLDNAVGKLAEYQQFLPSKPNWYVLATSREEIAGFEELPLDLLSPEDAIALFKKHYTRGKLSEAEITELVTMVDCHTLTVEILAKTAQQRIPLERLKTALPNKLKTRVAVPHSKNSRIENITAYLCSIFELNELDENDIWLMWQFACLPPDYHSYDLLIELISPVDQKRETEFNLSLEKLRELGWLQFHKETDGYKMHRVVVEVVKSSSAFCIEDVGVLLKNVTNTLNCSLKLRNVAEGSPLIPFGLALLDTFKEQEQWESVLWRHASILMGNLGGILRDEGRFYEAKDLLKLDLELNIKQYGVRFPILVHKYQNLGVIEMSLGAYTEAVKQLRKAKVILEDSTDRYHPERIKLYDSLAIGLLEIGEYDEANQLFMEAEKLAVEIYGEYTVQAALVYQSIARFFCIVDNKTVALEYSEKAYSIYCEKYGELNPITTGSLSNTALIYLQIGDLPIAKKLLDKAIANDEKNLGENHMITAERYINQANILEKSNLFREASNFAEKALKTFRSKLKADHPVRIQAEGIYQKIQRNS